MDAQEIVSKLGAIKDTATVERVFGEPHTVGERTIIPVAEVRSGMGFGFGSGKTRDEGEAAPEGEGGGGGGGATARPVGVIEVTPEATTFIPIKSGPPPWVLLLAGLGLGLLLGGKARVNITHHETNNECCHDE